MPRNNDVPSFIYDTTWSRIDLGVKRTRNQRERLPHRLKLGATRVSLLLTSFVLDERPTTPHFFVTTGTSIRLTPFGQRGPAKTASGIGLEYGREEKRLLSGASISRFMLHNDQFKR